MDAASAKRSAVEIVKLTVKELIERLSKENPDSSLLVYHAPEGSDLTEFIHYEQTAKGIILDGYVPKSAQTEYGTKGSITYIDKPRWISDASELTIKHMTENGWTFNLFAKDVGSGLFGYAVKFTLGDFDIAESDLDINVAIHRAAEAAHHYQEAMAAGNED